MTLHLEGQRFGRLVAVEQCGKDRHNRFIWRCLCDCGTLVNISGFNIKNGNTQSCGCLKIEAIKKSRTTHGNTVGGVFTTEYRIWAGMVSRCHNKKDKSYGRYGKKGISVCLRWRSSFEEFLSDVGKRPTTKHSLDRYPNYSGDYEPGNVRWATSKEQARNTSRNRFIVFRGRRMTLAEAAEIAGVNYRAALYRISKGRPIDEIRRRKNG